MKLYIIEQIILEQMILELIETVDGIGYVLGF